MSPNRKPENSFESKSLQILLKFQVTTDVIHRDCSYLQLINALVQIERIAKQKGT
jgi:hypothetical protein